jgi:hypothetical protein
MKKAVKKPPKQVFEFAIYELSNKTVLRLPKITFEELITSYQFKLEL